MKSKSKVTYQLAAEEMLQPNFIKKNIDKKMVKLRRVNPLTLITANRFDVMAKLLYLDFFHNNVSDNFGRSMYLAHIKLINGYVEKGSANNAIKVGADDFISSFNSVHKSIKVNFKPTYAIPLAANKSISDGAHRLASALYWKKWVFTFLAKGKEYQFDYAFFVKNNFPEIYLDLMALKYADLKMDSRLIILWPTADRKKHREVEGILESHGQIAYKKIFYIKPSKAWRLVKEVYKHEKWLGSHQNGFIGAKNKALWCFENDQPVVAYLYDSEVNLIKLKDKVRRLFGMGKNTIHITDKHEETMMLSKLVFNKNSMHWLNHYREKNCSWFNVLFKEYQENLRQYKKNIDFFCIDGSSVMSIYGLRDVRDIDFIHLLQKNVDLKVPGIEDHNKDALSHGIPINSIIIDPRFHFYYEGMKSVSLEQLKKYKQSRSERKDRSDLSIIESLILNKEKTILALFWENFSKHSIKNLIFLLALKMRFVWYKFVVQKYKK